jgi:hypothetical protein
MDGPPTISPELRKEDSVREAKYIVWSNSCDFGVYGYNASSVVG